MNYADPYQAYIQGSVLSTDPARLVVKLYERAIESVEKARQCLHNGDIWGRGQAINKSVHILGELLASLDFERGGTIAVSLQKLYFYMQSRLSEAHVKKAEAPMNEVEGLLKNLLEAWYVVADKNSARFETPKEAPAAWAQAAGDQFADLAYSGYYFEPVESTSGRAATF